MQKVVEHRKALIVEIDNSFTKRSLQSLATEFGAAYASLLLTSGAFRKL